MSAPAQEGEVQVRYKLEKGSEDWNFFQNLIETVPDFLQEATATKLKKRYPQFANYTTSILNTCIQNARKQRRKKEESEKKESEKKESKKKEEPTVEERSKFSLVCCCVVLFCCTVH